MLQDDKAHPSASEVLPRLTGPFRADALPKEARPASSMACKPEKLLIQSSQCNVYA